MKNSKKMNKTWMQFKVSTLSASITALILSGIPYQVSASDIDIYQSGGTGATRIYLMLDTSGSMNNYDSMAVDYDFTYKGQVCTTKLKDVGKDKGSYNKDGVFVGVGKGRYDQVNECLLESTATTRTCGRKVDQWGRTTWTNISILSNDLFIPGTQYKFGLANTDYYCSIDLDLITENTSVNNQYKSKISDICERVGSTNTYNCYSRMVNLRKGLISVVADATIDESIYFALGQYPVDIGSSSNAKYTGKTIFNFQVMDSDNKINLIKVIQGLTADDGTPIAPAYSVAADTLFANASSPTGATSLECTGNGVYFLTDGEPSFTGLNTTTKGYGNGSGDYSTILTKRSITSLNTNTLASDDYWKHVGNFAQSIRSSKYKVKTATVGFGGGYYLDATKKAAANISIGDKKYFDCSKLDTTGADGADHLSLCKWGSKTIPNQTGMGGFGEGGFYTAQSSADLVSSIKAFITDTTVPIEGTTMGSSTIPVDALNTRVLQPYAYFPMFKPLIGTEDQLWIGNLKKFNVSNGSLFDVKNIAVFKNDSEFNAGLQDYWYTSAGKNTDQFLNFGGNLSQLQAKMKVLIESNALKIKRNVWMNVDGKLKPVTDILAEGALADREYLYGLLGYSTLNSQDLINLKAKNSYADQLAYLSTLGMPKADYQLGAVIHSSPLLLTQKGVIEYKQDGFSSTDREDYILYGTTQGVVHVLKAGQQNKQSMNGVGVDAAGGEEVFAFVPQEMLAKQKTGFIESLAQKRSKPAQEGGGFFYGVDGPWTAHTEYEASIYQSVSLDGNGNKILDANNKEVMVQREGLKVDKTTGHSHQYVYGGLRMGGRSYYGLDLTDISKPEMLFEINPTTAGTNSPLQYMGQSWSKPTLTYIKWNGEKKLAMIVGGGYDERYESPTFKVTATNGSAKGNGIYIFDAKNGDLLWWGSSFAKDGNAVLNTDKTRVETPASSNISTMTNSIPSRIKAVDRNGDGVTDHLYVGDLGGQVFRIDLNSEHKISSAVKEVKPFAINAFKLADLNTAGKNPPRIYEAPTFTIHKSGGINSAVVTFVTGDRSSPLVTNTTNSQDMIVGLYDNGVTKPVPVAEETVAVLTNLKQIYNTAAPSVTNPRGWYYKLPINSSSTVASTVQYQSRGLAEGIALANDLYYSIFNPQKSNSSTSSATSCTGGIIGESEAYKLCLPSGECEGDRDIASVGKLGAGILALSIGPGSDSNSRTLILNNKSSSSSSPAQYATKDRLLPRRWFEYNPYAGK